MSFQKEYITGKFYQYIIRNIPMIIKEISDTKFDINYSKLVRLLYEEECKELNQTKSEQYLGKVFSDFIGTKGFIRHIINYFEIHNIEHDLNKNEKFTSIQNLCERTNGLFYQEKGYAKIQGTYGPYEFVDIILVHFDPKYAAMVHKIMDQIDRNAAIKEQTFEEEYNETLYKLEQMEDKFEDYDVDISELEEYRQLKEDIENHEYEFNPAINLILTTRITELQKLQRDLRIFAAYAYYIIKRNFTHIEQCKKPTLKDMLEIINPYISKDELNELENKEIRKKIISLATTNDERFSKLIANEIIEIFNKF